MDVELAVVVTAPDTARTMPRVAAAAVALRAARALAPWIDELDRLRAGEGEPLQHPMPYLPAGGG